MPKYMFLAHFQWEEDAGAYNVSYPDLPGCYTFGKDITEAMYMAKDALEGYLMLSEDENDEIPIPSSFQTLAHLIKEKDFIQYVEADTDAVRRREDQKAVNKMVTLPNYLVQLGKEKNINFSAILQKALKQELNINE